MAININILSSFKNTGFQRLEKELTRLDTPMQKIQATAKALGPAATVAFGALAYGATQAIQAAEAAQVADNRLQKIAESMGIFGDETSKVTDRLKAFADQTMKSTAIDDEQIKATQAKLLTFKNLAETADVVGGAMDRATLAALDLAAAGFGSAETNATQLGKALQDPVKGITALARAGVTFTEQEKEKIKALVQSGDLLGAQNMILGAIETQVGGTAEATATASQKMQTGFAELTEKIGTALLPVFEAILPPVMALLTFMEENTGVVIALAVVFGILSAAILAVNIAMYANPITLIIAGVAALIAGIVLLVDWLVKMAGGWDKVISAAEEGLTNVGQWFNDVFTAVVDWFKSLPGQIVKLVVDSKNWLLDTGRNIIDGLLKGLKGAWDGVINWIKGAGENISNAFKAVLGIKSPSRVFESHGENIGEGLVKGMDSMQTAVEKSASELGSFANKGFTMSLKELTEAGAMGVLAGSEFFKATDPSQMASMLSQGGALNVNGVTMADINAALNADAAGLAGANATAQKTGKGFIANPALKALLEKAGYSFDQFWSKDLMSDYTQQLITRLSGGFSYKNAGGGYTASTPIVELTSEFLNSGNNDLRAGTTFDAITTGAIQTFIDKTKGVLAAVGAGEVGADTRARLAADLAKAEALIPALATGGVVMPQPGGVIARLAEANKPEAVIPLDRLGSMGGNQYNVTVNAGLGSDGVSIGQIIIDQIKKFERSSGPVFARA